ncbi:MAG TPA: 50S ribosomal protein L6 [bacterium]|nr:50S ribosomal protein L6 [bacterium]
MSRIGKQPVKIPAGVKASKDGAELRLEGPKGKTAHKTNPNFVYEITADAITVKPAEAVSLADRRIKALYGMERSLIDSRVKGVLEGYTKTLLLKGVGYRAQLQGKTLNFTLGFSHPINYRVPDGITVTVDNQTKVIVSGIDKHMVGQVAADIRMFKPPEPYQGKGVMYENEQVRRKAGKSAAGAKGAK